jgi:hypothetical protein
MVESEAILESIEKFSASSLELQQLVLTAKELNLERGVEDTPENVTDSLLAIVRLLSSKPIDELRKSKRVCKANKDLERMERDASDYLQSINKINIGIRAATSEYESLTNKMKQAKESVLEEYKGALGEFKELMDETNIVQTEENTPPDASNPFNTLLADVIREVLIENEAIPVEGAAEGTTNEVPSFEALFEDQNLASEFQGVFSGEDDILPPTTTPPISITIRHIPDEPHPPLPPL